ncbi:MAG: hypothetical protein WCC94_03095 [Candidatus Bathyarchaeia archaeon]
MSSDRRKLYGNGGSGRGFLGLRKKTAKSSMPQQSRVPTNIMIVVVSPPVANPKAVPTGVRGQKPSLEMAQEKTTEETSVNHKGDEPQPQPQDEQRRKGIGRFLRAD